ncbi:two-component sensor histidine kinase [Pseudoclavibacter endophyticus]|uniref:histidine kinase n=1 Tax=Pseudoclavibacter endophyticus TaxID=1778590 RepID=A0A6H9WN63_9MICO|nr:HAMP domain-containing sensor histidine kinase [Pseudoclavibacter endophyticus]KAB1649528.1 HAMP domain-containing histidine kinase [Pseudoclavibacter endophyticus]GGA61892.1 two-component sensor histidine kinase [Pseudoclavibacter endophyticus]
MRRAGASVRVRLVTAVVVLLALALGVLTFLDISLQRQQVISRIDTELDRRWNELIQLTATGVDPETGRAFETADQLVRVALQRTVPAPNEGELGIVDGAVAWTAQAEVPTRLEDDPEFLAHIAVLTSGSSVVRGSVTTNHTTYDYLIVPVAVSNEPTTTVGAVVYAFDRNAELEVVATAMWWRLLLATGVFVIGATVIWFLVGRLMRPIGLVRQTAEEITDTDLSRRIPVHGNDDLAQLTVTVNSMLDRLETAMSSQRNLLDDVGHELRTPLTVVRGHLELMDAGDPSDARATRDLVVDEIDRMNRLVNDLTLLAAASRPDFATLQPVHVGLLVDDALEKARSLGDRNWRLGGFVDTEAMLDAQRITQALLQLAANAVRYSESGTSVTFAAIEDGEHIRLSVRDEGRGIPSGELEGIFDRFARVRQAGDRIDGSGLGLAIVRSICDAHGGTVEVVSAIGMGSTFTLVLPRRAATGAEVTQRDIADELGTPMGGAALGGRNA